MAVSASDVAKAQLPGWQPVGKPSDTPRAIGAEPTVQALCKKYGIKAPSQASSKGLKAASSATAELEFVVMAPPEGAASGNKVVVVANGKVVAIQG